MRYTGNRGQYEYTFDSKDFMRSFWWMLALISAWNHIGVLVFLFICFAEVRMKFNARNKRSFY